MSTPPTVMGFHYTLKDKDGTVIDSSDGRDPLYVMLGQGHIVQGLDEVLPEMNPGETRTIIVPPEKGYGLINEELRLKVPKDQFPAGTEFAPGDQFRTSQEPGSPIYTVHKVDDTNVYIDGNPMLAGVELHFDIEAVEKRPASAEEIEHGHAHGPGAHAG